MKKLWLLPTSDVTTQANHTHTHTYAQEVMGSSFVLECLCRKCSVKNLRSRLYG